MFTRFWVKFFPERFPDAFPLDRGRIAYRAKDKELIFSCDMLVNDDVDFVIFKESNPLWSNGEELTSIDYDYVIGETKRLLLKRGIRTKWVEQDNKREQNR